MTDPVIHRMAEGQLGAAFRLGPVRSSGNGWWCYDGWETNGTAAVSVRVQRRPRSGEEWETQFDAHEQRVAELDHPHLLRLRSYGFTEELCWLVTERVEGTALVELLELSGPLTLRATLRILEQAASALDYAHRRGHVHGSLTTADIWIVDSDWVMVGGLGAPQGGGVGGPSAWDDLRAFARVAWQCLTGSSETGLSPSDLDRLPPRTRSVIAAVLTDPRPPRYGTVLEFVSALGAAEPEPLAPEAAAKELPVPSDVLFLDPRPPLWRRRLAMTAAAALGLVLVAGGTLAIRRGTARAEIAAAPVVAERDLAPIAPSSSASIGAVSPAPPPPVRLAVPDSSTAPKPAAPGEAAATRPTPIRAAPAIRQPPVTRRARPAKLPARKPRGRAEPSAARTPPANRPPAAPGHLFVSTRPWGTLFLDDERIANTPIAGLKVPPGSHTVRITRTGFRPYQQTLRVEPGDEVRLIDLILEPVAR